MKRSKKYPQATEDCGCAESSGMPGPDLAMAGSSEEPETTGTMPGSESARGMDELSDSGMPENGMGAGNPLSRSQALR